MGIHAQDDTGQDRVPGLSARSSQNQACLSMRSRGTVSGKANEDRGQEQCAHSAKNKSRDLAGQGDQVALQADGFLLEIEVLVDLVQVGADAQQEAPRRDRRYELVADAEIAAV